MGPITGKTIVVTGGSRGIGLGLVKRFLSRNNHVVATTREPATATALQELSQQYSSHLTVSQLDTASEGGITEWAAALQGQLKHVDVLVNNAGAYGGRVPFTEFTSADLMSAFQLNAVGPFLVTQQLYKAGLLGGGEKSNNSKKESLVVNISSIVASHGDPTVSATSPGGYAYRASKAALNIINKSLTIDLNKEGVQAVLIHPGYVKTDLTGGAGWITVDESTDGILRVLEGEQPLNGRFLAYSGEEIPW